MLKVIKAFAIVDNKRYSLNMNLKDEEMNFEGGSIDIGITNSSEKSITTIIRNNSDNGVNLNSVELELFNLEAKTYNSFIINSENSQDDIDFNIVNSNISNESYQSFLFTYLAAVDNYENIFIGFLSSHKSRNYIKINLKGNKVTVSVVFDFVSHFLKNGEELNLDEIYMDFNKQIIENFNSYVNLINIKCFEKSNEFNEIYNEIHNEDKLIPKNDFNILFEDKASEVSLVKNEKPYCIKLSGKNAYPIDISKIEGKRLILDRLKAFCEDRVKSLYFKNIIPYINTVVENKAFNPYYELGNLLSDIKREFNFTFTFDDCPLGIAISKELTSSHLLRGRFWSKNLEEA